MNNSYDFNRWDIWIAKVEFEECSGHKIRPVLVIDGTRCFVLSLKITSHNPRDQYLGEYQIKEWKEAGLMKPSTIRISKVLHLPVNLFVKKIGTLTELDRANVSNIYRDIYNRIV